MEGQKGGRLWGNPGRRPRTDVSTPILPDAKNCVDTARYVQLGTPKKEKNEKF